MLRRRSTPEFSRGQDPDLPLQYARGAMQQKGEREVREMKCWAGQL